MIYITGANGWLGLNLIDAIHSGRTTKWGLEKDELKAFICQEHQKKNYWEYHKILILLKVIF